MALVLRNQGRRAVLPPVVLLDHHVRVRRVASELLATFLGWTCFTLPRKLSAVTAPVVAFFIAIFF